MQLLLDSSDVLPHPSCQQVQEAGNRRRALLESIEAKARSSFGMSKPHLGPLSPGCVFCGNGQWSCMFLNSVCNARCFFCSTDMDAPSAPPFAERIVFSEPLDYAEYLLRLGFKGASFSGGEPFLTPDKLVAYIRAVRSRLPSPFYLWAYTNGRVATPANIERAAVAGLDELRFNIAAFDYDLGPVRAAVGLVERVSVEIPAIPEDIERLKRLLPEIRSSGVKHLNLHQLMVMGQNAPHLVQREYTFLDSATPPVVESELAALEILGFALDEGIDLAINYCSLVYKERWQNRIEDFRAGALVRRDWETQTETGCIRRLVVRLTGEQARAAEEQLDASGIARSRWTVDGSMATLGFHPSLWAVLKPLLDGSRPDLFVSYHRTVVGEQETGEQGRSLADYHECRLSPTKTIGIRLLAVSPPIPLGIQDMDALCGGEPCALVEAYETIPRGLAEYR